MAHLPAHPDVVEAEARTLDKLGPRLLQIGGGVGAVFIAVSIVLGAIAGDNMRHFLYAWLTGFCFYLSLAIGSLFFVALLQLTRAGWSATVRRIAEFSAATFPVLFLFAIPIVIGGGEIFDWWGDDKRAASDISGLLEHKKPYLNEAFFIGRVAFYFLFWWGLSTFILKRSLKQDETGNTKITNLLERINAPAIILLALTTTFAAFDFIMSLAPHWYSTILGVYYFGGAMMSSLAMIILIAMFLQKQGKLRHVVSADHFQDLGKLMFAFIVFWAYIAFSQFMLIWYAAIPEEVSWYYVRTTDHWEVLAGVLLFGHFLLPFLFVMSRAQKRRKATLAAGAIWLLIMHYFDMYWLIMPEMNQAAYTGTVEAFILPFNVMDITIWIGMGGLFVAWMSFVAGKRSLVAVKDPRLVEALAFHNA